MSSFLQSSQRAARTRVTGSKAPFDSTEKLNLPDTPRVRLCCVLCSRLHERGSTLGCYSTLRLTRRLGRMTLGRRSIVPIRLSVFVRARQNLHQIHVLLRRGACGS
eukprot:2004720-Rhodomonas_salina.1